MASTVETVTFPDETAEYRTARNRLLEAEKELRRQVEAVAALRRTLPPGGKLREDYTFTGWQGTLDDGQPLKERFTHLLATGRDSLLAYSMMYGPNMEQPCPSCTSIVDALNTSAPHIVQRANLVVIMRSPIERLVALARQRGWNNLRFLSSADNTYNLDYHAENENGGQLPIMNVFVRRADGIHHWWASELLYGAAEPGQDQRHVDMIWPLWNLFDMLPEGRGTGWYPRLSYDD
jgi:predicted dithiol-disulfide oxidoreductase (DUF899 family)